MLSVPKHGWSEFTLSEECSYSLSYLTDVALEWLGQAIHGLETLEPFCVHGFCEPGRMLCTVSYWTCYIIFERDGILCTPGALHFFECNTSMIEFCQMLYRDISDNFDAWVNWELNDPEDYEDELTARKMELAKQLERLSVLLEETKEHFGENRCFT